jgi:hypothetical protein
VARYKNEMHLFENGNHYQFNLPEVTFGAGAGTRLLPAHQICVSLTGCMRACVCGCVWVGVCV